MAGIALALHLPLLLSAFVSPVTLRDLRSRCVLHTDCQVPMNAPKAASLSRARSRCSVKMLVPQAAFAHRMFERRPFLLPFAGRRTKPPTAKVVNPNVGLAKSVGRCVRSELLQRASLSPLPEPFTVLGIETSCDDTGVAVVRSDGVVLGEAIASQASLHEEFGGVFPTVARDAHQAELGRVIALALARANLTSVADVDAVAVTVGPGLEICLRVGCEQAKALAMEHNKPFVGVHHLEAHLLMARLACSPPPRFPFLTLLVSGGHCQLLLSRGLGDHKIIGGTLDDALGEAYDKIARMLELPVGGGGGPALEALAREGDPHGLKLTVPLSRKRKNSCDLSFAGLKTSVRRQMELCSEERRQEPSFRADVAASFQHAALTHVERKLKQTMELCSEQAATWGVAPNTLVLSGGVAANSELRRRVQALCDATAAPVLPNAESETESASAEGQVQIPWRMLVPPPRLCTDNGLMVAWAAVEYLRAGEAHVPEGQQVRARWPLGRSISTVKGTGLDDEVSS